jgi:hypothetical protein
LNLNAFSALHIKQQFNYVLPGHTIAGNSLRPPWAVLAALSSLTRLSCLTFLALRSGWSWTPSRPVAR